VFYDQDFIHITFLCGELIEKAKAFIAYPVPDSYKRNSLLHRSAAKSCQHNEGNRGQRGSDMANPDQQIHFASCDGSLTLTVPRIAIEAAWFIAFLSTLV
jgi:hypothetical protein